MKFENLSKKAIESVMKVMDIDVTSITIAGIEFGSITYNGKKTVYSDIDAIPYLQYSIEQRPDNSIVRVYVGVKGHGIIAQSIDDDFATMYTHRDCGNNYANGGTWGGKYDIKHSLSTCAIEQKLENIYKRGWNNDAPIDWSKIAEYISKIEKGEKK
jgi:hypothetical protein